MRIAAISGSAGQQCVECLAGGIRREIERDHARIRQVLRKRREDGRKAFLQHQHLHRGIGQDEELLGDREPPVQRHHDRAEAGAGIEQDQIVWPVHAQDRDAITATNAAFRLQCLRRRLDPRVEHGIAERLALEMNRGLVGRKCGVAGDEAGEIHDYSSFSPAS